MSASSNDLTTVHASPDDLLHIARQCYDERRYHIVYSSCWAGHIKIAILNTKNDDTDTGCGFPIEHVLAAYTVDEGWRDLI